MAGSGERLPLLLTKQHRKHQSSTSLSTRQRRRQSINGRTFCLIGRQALWLPVITLGRRTMSPDLSYSACHEMVHYASAWLRLFLLWTFSLPARPKMAQTPHLGISRAQLLASSYFRCSSNPSCRSLRFATFSPLSAQLNSAQLSSSVKRQLALKFIALAAIKAISFWFGAWPCVKATHLI